MKAPRGFKALVVVVAALGLATGIASAASNGAAASMNAPSPQLLEALKAQASGTVSVSTEDSTTYLGFIRVDHGGDLLPSSSGGAEAKAQDFVSQYGALLGVGDSSGSLVPAGVDTDEQGATHVTYNQVYQGVPVFGGTIIAHVDADGSLTGINGNVVPDINLGTTPKLSEAQAGQRAIAHVIADPPRDENGNPPEFLTAADLTSSAKLVVYRVGLIRGVPGTSQLVYEVEVTNGTNVREFVYVHAHAGKILNRYSTIGGALFRRLFEMHTSNQVWQEGDPFPGSLNIDQQNIVIASGHSYYHFFNAFGRDSYDGAGAELQSVNNDPTIACPNANWNGATTNYCNGVTADDVVAHEWGHAYTQYTHNLIYQWQPGALNESYSDIWGETVDLINGYGTDSPAGLRTVGSCSSHTTGVPVLVINSPAPGICQAGGAEFGPELTATGTTGDLVLGLDPADAAGPSTTDACSPLTNATEVNGKIALVDRGTCAFTVKVKNAQDAGAIGAVVANTLGRGPFGMIGVDPTITIPSVGISNAHGDLLKGYLAQPEGSNVTLKLTGSTSAPEDSYRWLMGEDATAFGGAIRDMWTPTCRGDPGKVSDAEYFCATDDGGGVHTNSGVPNHGYALLVDGTRGVPYNGQNIDAIGLVKAAHLYWRAQSVYQTPTSDFTDHANALEASCADLIGLPLEGLSTEETPAGPSGESFTAADCASVTAMIAAVELRTEPTQCNFQPLLDPNAPRLCPDGQRPDRLYRERFEQGGLRGWTLSNEGVFAGWPGLDWQIDSSLPGGREGSAAFAADPDAGNCDAGAGDISGVMHLESPVIRLRALRRTQSMRLAFDHYVATEAGWDGGNIKISVNGGPYELIRPEAFLFNAYNTVINPPEAGNTNPLAGEPGWSGTDGGEVFGSWGESQVDLTALGLKSGDRIRLRFDFGMDGCAGVDGWYVDDIEIVACRAREGDDDDNNDVTATESARRS